MAGQIVVHRPQGLRCKLKPKQKHILPSEKCTRENLVQSYVGLQSDIQEK